MEKKALKKSTYTDQEINDLADWIGDLTIAQAFFIRELYLNLLKQKASEAGQRYVH